MPKERVYLELDVSECISRDKWKAETDYGTLYFTAEQLEELRGECLIERLIEDAVERWHDSPHMGLSLDEYLNWTPEEYALWVQNGTLPKAIRSLKQGGAQDG